MVADVALESNPTYIVRDFGSKEEAFFDSQLWLESDCEDDFSSVNGDFIPSQSSTPVHHCFSVENPVSVPLSSSADKKKKLSDLLKERLQVDHDLDEQNASGNQNVDDAEVKAVVPSIVLPPKSAVVSPDVPGANFADTTERTLNGLFSHDDKSVKSRLPRLISSRSFSKRKKRMNLSRREKNWVRSFSTTYMRRTHSHNF